MIFRATDDQIKNIIRLAFDASPQIVSGGVLTEDQLNAFVLAPVELYVGYCSGRMVGLLLRREDIVEDKWSTPPLLLPENWRVAYPTVEGLLKAAGVDVEGVVVP